MPSASGMSFERSCLLFAALVFIMSAWFGVGYNSEDEHHQVIAFAEALRGNVSEETLAYEYHTRIRSMVMPVLCAGVFEVCDTVGVADPFLKTFLLRLLTTAMALWVIHGFVRTVLPKLNEDLRRPFILLSFFLWFIPVLNIRFNGETWSGLLFLRGLTLLMGERDERKMAVAGLWFGAAILFRPAVAMLPLGAVLWLIFMQRTAWVDVLKLVVTGCAALLLGVLMDSIVYGEPVFTLWNYTRTGVLGGEAWRFTPLPWYYHILFVIKYTVPAIGLVLIASYTVLAAFRTRHVLVWVLTPFLIAHSVLPVKELRYLFPLAPLMPWLLIAAWQVMHERWPAMMARAIWSRLIFLIALVNVLALLVGMTTPAGNGRIKLARAVQDRYGAEPVHIDHLGDWRQWIPPFYLATRSTEAFVEKVIIDPGLHGANHLVIAKRSLDMDRIAVLETIAVATPAWTDRLLGWYMLEDSHDPLILYRVTTQNTGH